MSKQQTAVEFLVEKLIEKNLLILNGETLKTIGQAKELFEHQIIESYRSGRVDQQSPILSTAYNTKAKDFFKQTFNPK